MKLRIVSLQILNFLVCFAAQAEWRAQEIQSDFNHFEVRSSQGQGQGWMRFGEHAPYQTAVEAIVAEALGKNLSLRLLESEQLVVRENQWQSFLHASSRIGALLKWDRSFGKVDALPGAFQIQIRRAYLSPLNQEKIPFAYRVWLGCMDETSRLCLGLSDSISNVDLLETEVNASQKDAIRPAELKEFADQTAKMTLASLQIKLVQLGFPKTLSHLIGLKLMARRASLLSEASATALSFDTKSFTAKPEIENGEIVREFPDFSTDLTRGKIESLIARKLIENESVIEKAAKSLLAHFPYITIGGESETGKLHFSPGFMVRMKRKIEQNPSAQSVRDSLKVIDSLEIFVSMGVGINKKAVLVRGGVGAGPAYIRRYRTIRTAGSLEEAENGYWMIPIRQLVFASVAPLALKSGETLSVDEGFALSGGLDGRIETPLKNLLRPQGYLMGNFFHLKTASYHRNENGSILAASGTSVGEELFSQLFGRSMMKLARAPFFSFRVSNSKKISEVYEISKEAMEEAILFSTPRGRQVQMALRTSELHSFEHQFPKVDVKTNGKTFDFWFTNVFFVTDQRSWRGGLQLQKPEGSSWLEKDRFFYLTERSEKRKQRLFGPRIESSCNYWGALDLKDTKAQDVTRLEQVNEGLIRIKCRLSPHRSEDFSKTDLARLAEKWGHPSDRIDSLWGSEHPSRIRNLEVRFQIPWNEIQPLLASTPTGWVLDFANELKTKQSSPARVSDTEANEIRLLATVLRQIYSTQDLRERFELFFSWIADSPSRDAFLKSLNQRNSKLGSNFVVVLDDLQGSEIQRESEFQIQRTGNTFQILEEREQWNGME